MRRAPISRHGRTVGAVAAILIGCRDHNASTADTTTSTVGTNVLSSSRQDSDSARTAPAAASAPISGESKPTVRLVESTVNGVMADPVAKVEVTAAGNIDTIPALVTSLDPVVTNDGMIHGISMTAGGEASNGYDYDSRTRKLTVFKLPSDVNGFFHEIEINADANYFAYVAHVQSGQTWAVVRLWPGMTVVARTPPSDGYPSDVGYDQVEWKDVDHYRISYRIRSGSSIVVQGDAHKGMMKVDTVSTPPSQ